jgi:hypothetical protein
LPPYVGNKLSLYVLHFRKPRPGSTTLIAFATKVELEEISKTVDTLFLVLTPESN